MRHPVASRKNRQERAFSLLELICVLGVVFILIGLMLPTLRSARERARSTLCTAQLHQHMGTLVSYALDQQDFWPYPLGPRFTDPYTNQQLQLSTPYGFYNYTWAGSYWVAPIVSYYGMDPFDRSLDCPKSRILSEAREAWGYSGRAWSTARELSMAMLLDPEALGTQGVWDQRLFRVQRHGDVMFPSLKSALFEPYPFHDDRAQWSDHTVVTPPPWRIAVAGCDGSSTIRSQSDCAPGVVFSQFRPRFEGAARVQATMDSLRFTPGGVRGIDWR